MPTGVRVLLVGAAVAVGVAACSGGGGGGQARALHSTAQTDSLAAIAPESGGSTGAGGAQTLAGAAAPRYAPAGGGSGRANTPSIGDNAIAGRDLVERADVTVSVHDVGSATSTAAAIAGRLHGYVSAESVVTDPHHASHDSGTITLRVPQSAYETALRELGRLGTQTSLQRSVTDVTSETIDVASRLQTQHASIDRIRTLLTHATDLGQVIALESELTNRQADLESLEHRLRALKNEVALATIDARFVRQNADKAHHDKHHHGFLGGLLAGWDAFVDAAGGVATAVGAVLPFLAFLIVVVALGAGYRRRPRRASTVD